MHGDYEIIKSDFNAIAKLGPEPRWNHNNCYFPLLLRQVPPGAKLCLDIGCGKGELTALLAKRAERVVAVDLAEKMIGFARAHSAGANIEYVCGNILDMDFAPESFDVIISTATAHHLPYAWLLAFAKEKLRPGGKLLLLDLARPGSPADYLVWGLAAAANPFMNLLKNGRLRKGGPQAAALWRRHGEHDRYMTLREVRALAGRQLPGAAVRRRLFWRYTLAWEKP